MTGDELVSRQVGWKRAWLLGVVYLVALVPLSYAPRLSGNVWSRYMTIESVVERGTLSIDRSPLRARSGSPDLIKVGGHFYSDKPPVLPALTALVYGPLYWAGWRMSGPPVELLLVNWVLVVAVAGVGSALSVVGLRMLLQAAPVARWAADLLALLGGLTTQVLSYAVTYNNHSVAAGLLTVAFAMVGLEAEGEGRKWVKRFVAGLLAALAATVDLPAGGAVMAGLAVLLAARMRRPPLAFVLGCLGPLVLHAGLQVGVTGSPLPAELTPRVFEYEGSYWLTEEGKWVEPGPRWQFGLELLFGPGGWLTVTPVLGLGLVGVGLVAARRGDRLRGLAVVVGVVTIVLVGYYVFGVRRTDFAGQSFGTRHLLPISPVVYGFAVILAGRVRRVWLWLIFGFLMVVGTVYAVAGMRDPWSRVERRPDRALVWVGRLTVYPWSRYSR